MRPRDTSPEAWNVLMDLLRKIPPEEKLRRALAPASRLRDAPYQDAEFKIGCGALIAR